MKSSTKALILALDVIALNSPDGIACSTITEASKQLRAFQWVASATELPSDSRPNDRESLLCLCIHKGRPCLLRWNYHYKVWDDEEGDDFYCSPLDVSLWMEFPDWPAQQPIQHYPPFNG
jgi:hypothetical protein